LRLFAGARIGGRPVASERVGVGVPLLACVGVGVAVSAARGPATNRARRLWAVARRGLCLTTLGHVFVAVAAPRNAACVGSRRRAVAVAPVDGAVQRVVAGVALFASRSIDVTVAAACILTLHRRTSRALLASTIASG